MYGLPRARASGCPLPVACAGLGETSDAAVTARLTAHRARGAGTGLRGAARLRWWRRPARREPSPAAPDPRRRGLRDRADVELPRLARRQHALARCLVGLAAALRRRGPQRDRPHPVHDRPLVDRPDPTRRHAEARLPRRRAHPHLQRARGDPAPDDRRRRHPRTRARDLGARRRQPARGPAARRRPRRALPGPRGQHARQGRQSQSRARAPRRGDRRHARRRPRSGAQLLASHAALLRRRSRRRRADAPGLLQRRLLRARGRRAGPSLRRGSRLLSRDRTGQERVRRRLLVRDLGPDPDGSPARGRRRRHGDRHRGHPHHDPAQPQGLEGRLPQRSARARPRTRQRRGVHGPAQPLGDGRDAGPAYRESADDARPHLGPAPLLRDHALRLVRQLADLRLHGAAPARRPHRRVADRRPGPRLRPALRRHLPAAVRRAAAAGARLLPSAALTAVRGATHAGRAPRHARGARIRAFQEGRLPGHPQGPQRGS